MASTSKSKRKCKRKRGVDFQDSPGEWGRRVGYQDEAQLLKR